MKTVAEIDATGEVVRIFHRTQTASWTHAPGEKYRYWGGRHGSEHWVEMGCPCTENFPRTAEDRSDTREAGERPGAIQAEPATIRMGAP